MSDPLADVAKRLGTRPEVVYTGRQLGEVVAETYEAFKGLQKRMGPFLYDLGGVLTRIRHVDGRPVPEPVGRNALINYMSHAARWVKIVGKDKKVDAFPPQQVAEAVLAAHTWPFPPLRGIVETPVLRPDGTILATPGYDEATLLLYLPPPGPKVPQLPDFPTDDDLRQAAATLDDAFDEFPWDDPKTDRANFYGLLLTPVMRPVIPDPGLPMMALIDASGPRSGKTLLGLCTGIVNTGRTAPTITVPTGPHAEEEFRKRITSKLLQAPVLVLLDNVKTRLSSAALCVALTTHLWEDRILGHSRMAQLPNRAAWMATGNNLRGDDEVVARSYWIRLVPKTSRPDLRTFRHPNLVRHVTVNRGRFIWALLVIARAWHLAGRPEATGLTNDVFSDWARTIGGALTNAGIEGFLGNLTAMRQQVDRDTGDWESFLTACETHYGHWHHKGRWETPGQLVGDLEGAVAGITVTAPHEVDRILEAGTTRRGKATRIGKLLLGMRDRRHGERGLRIVTSRDNHAKSNQWRIEADQPPHPSRNVVWGGEAEATSGNGQNGLLRDVRDVASFRSTATRAGEKTAGQGMNVAGEVTGESPVRSRSPAKVPQDDDTTESGRSCYLCGSAAKDAHGHDPTPTTDGRHVHPFCTVTTVAPHERRDLA